MKILLVDDELPARNRMRELLDGEKELEIVGECGNGDEALQAIGELQPDLVFLDIQMPGKNGLEMLAELSPNDRPHIVFVTGYDEYAIKAFEMEALDYLLKPYSRDRLMQSVKRVRQISEGSENGEISYKIDRLLHSLSPRLPRPYPTRLVIKDGTKISIVPVGEIVCLLAEGNYVEVCTVDRRRLLLRETMQSLDSRLDPAIFFRASRSAMIHLGQLREIESAGKSGHFLHMNQGIKVHLTASLNELQQRLLSV